MALRRTRAGLAGTGTELFLIEHYEDPLQFVPLATIAIAVLVIVWHAANGERRAFARSRPRWCCFSSPGSAGMWFHFRGGAEFQLEIDPAQSRWDIFTKVMRAKAPPVLASGVMVQLGLLGLVYAYRHPALNTESS